MNEQTRSILEVKRAQRDRLVALPFARKIEILEQLRAPSLDLSKTTLRRPASHRGGGTKSA